MLFTPYQFNPSRLTSKPKSVDGWKVLTREFFILYRFPVILDSKIRRANSLKTRETSMNDLRHCAIWLGNQSTISGNSNNTMTVST